MPFKFIYLCDLLSQLEDHATRDPPLLISQQRDLDRRAIESWFRSHRRRIDDSGTSRAALLSALFPERRTDRVYGLREKSLVNVLGRCLCLGTERRKELLKWQCGDAAAGDLAACVERVQRQAEMPLPHAENEVTVEEIDEALGGLAAGNRFSCPAVRKGLGLWGVESRLRNGDGHFQGVLEGGHHNEGYTSVLDRKNQANLHRSRVSLSGDTCEKLFGPIFCRLQSREAKWLTRMILKNYGPVVLPEQMVLRLVHFLLPDLLYVRSSFNDAIEWLQSPELVLYPSQPGNDVENLLRTTAAKLMVPKVGCKVARAPFLKARSIKHCVNTVGSRRVSVERKYDGEYCQVHVDLSRDSKDHDWIQIFSKSGKDSTEDRRAIHSAIKSCLGIGTNRCKFSQKCILEGELVVYSDKERKVLEFHELRKHIPRAGRFLGAELDSPPDYYEHLMIIFFDVQLIDEENLSAMSYDDRRKRLKNLVTPVHGHAGLVEREQMTLSSSKDIRCLRKRFGTAIRKRWEGLVIKPCAESSWHPRAPTDNNYTGRWIKLKKDYIKGLGDTADFAVIAARYDGRIAHQYNSFGSRWNVFYLGCLVNKETVLRFSDKPKFRVIEALDYAINAEERRILNHVGQFRSTPASELGSTTNSPFDMWSTWNVNFKPDVIFHEPFVVEIMGSGFDKPSSADYFTLRFP